MLSISIRSNIDQVSKDLGYLAYKQLPFATAQTVNALAVLAKEAEKKAMPEVFDNPTPFTINSVSILRATKLAPVATVFIKDKTADYLAPYEYGGMQFLGSKPASLMPIQASANQWGNLPLGSIKKYMGRKDCFMGEVKTKKGMVYGIWQRPTAVATLKGAKQKRLANTTGGLKLLVAFKKPTETKKRLNFGDRAASVVEHNFDAVFDEQMAKAVSNSR